MGHQLGANHTWSHESEGSLVQAEPASGTTIMGYAGIVGINNVASHGDDYFHYLSILQIVDYLETISCGESISLTNIPPVITSTGNFVIPKSTAFVLEGKAADVDLADILTYTWEQIDDGIVTQATFGPTNPSGANFRSQKPSVNSVRYFPKLSSVLQGNLTQTNPTIASTWETVSDIGREMNFAFTVRDNGIGGGQVVSDLVNVSIVDDAGPFKVLSQATEETVVAGSEQTIEWDVANTYAAPINCFTVDILLSTDGGLTFPIFLAQNVPNNGSHKIVIPGGIPTTTARISITANDNVFYAVNASNFTIEESSVVLSFSDLEYGVCQPDDLMISFNYETYLGFSEETTFSIPSAPPELTISLLPLVTTIDTPVEITISNTINLAEGIYPITILATSLGNTSMVTFDVAIYDMDFPDVLLLSPSDEIIDVSTQVLLEWENNTSYTSFDVEIANDDAFTDIIETATVLSNSYLPSDLQNQSTYYWRVKPKNNCGEGAFGAIFSFALHSN